MKLTSYLAHFKKEVVFGPIFKLLEAVFELFVPLVMANIIDVGVKNGDVSFILSRGGILVALAAAGLGFSLTCQYFASRASQGTGTLLRRDLFQRINSLSYKEIDNVGTPTLITRITSDINQVQTGVAMVIRLALRSPILVVGCTVMALFVDWKIGLAFLVVIPLMTLILYLILKTAIPLYKVIQSKLDRITLISRENLSGQRVVRAFAKEDKEIERFDRAADDYTKSAMFVGKITALLNPLTYVVINLAVVAVVWFGGLQVNVGNLTQGKVLALVNYLMQILLALVVTADLVIIFTKSSASLARLKDVFAISSSLCFPERSGESDADTEASEKPSAAFAENGKIAEAAEASVSDQNVPAIEFRNVTLRYSEGAKPAVDALSFRLLRGQTLGIIGGTGSGKSSIVNLIPRFYDCSEGEVLLYGKNVKEYTEDDLNKTVAVVPQKAVLFSGTIRSNLLWGDERASDEALYAALKTAQAEEFVLEKQGGLDAPVSQNGKNLSGGQKQRLCIARALVKNSGILILDDSASALDYRTDSKLRKAIRHDRAGTTTVLVSQRVATVRSADLILVLDGGFLVGAGTHDELVKNCGTYYDIYRSQTREEA